MLGIDKILLNVNQNEIQIDYCLEGIDVVTMLLLCIHK